MNSPNNSIAEVLSIIPVLLMKTRWPKDFKDRAQDHTAGILIKAGLTITPHTVPNMVALQITLQQAIQH